MGVHEHRHAAPSIVPTFVLTVSDTRTPKDDASGNLIVEKLERVGHCVVGREIVRDEVAEIRTVLERETASSATWAVLVSGGTGICARDVTIEAVKGIIQKEIPGFGEVFRALSFQEIGSAAIFSRAIAGVAYKTVIFAMPGSPAAVELAMERIILPEIGHAVFEATK